MPEATPENVGSYPESCSVSFFEWFSNNQTKANPELSSSNEC